MGFWNSVFSDKSDLLFQDFSSLNTDVHSHLIAGIDDGSANLEESTEMVRGLSRLGYRKLITTPHIMTDFYGNTPELIKKGLIELQQAVDQEGIPVIVKAAAEYMIDDEFENKLKEGNLMTFGDNYLLIELSTFTPHPNLKTILFDLQIAGYTTVLAHAERYTYWYNEPEHFRDFKDRDILIQVNTLSFSGYYSRLLRLGAEKLANAGMIDLLGSDLHKPAALPALKKAVKERYVQKLMDSGKLLNSSL